MTKQFLSLFILTGLIFISCKELSSKQITKIENPKTHSVDNLIIYQSENLIIKKLTNHIFEHISFCHSTAFLIP